MKDDDLQLGWARMANTSPDSGVAEMKRVNLGPHV